MQDEGHKEEICTDINEKQMQTVTVRLIDGLEHFFMDGSAHGLIGRPRANVLHYLRKHKEKIVQFVNLTWAGTRQMFRKYEAMCPQAKKVYDSFGVLISHERAHDKFHREFWAKVRDIVCLIMQDIPYRWRIIDLFETAAALGLKMSPADLEWIKHQDDYNYDGKHPEEK